MDENLLSQTIRNIPPELSGSVPRKVGFSERSRLMPVVIALLIGATVISWSLYCNHMANQIRQRSVLRTEGAEAQAEITYLKRAGRGPDVVKYTFTANGQNVFGMADVPPGLVQNLKESNFLTVRYLPSNPTINHPTAWEWSLSSEWLLIVMLMCPLILCITTLPGAYRDRQLLVWGAPVTGTVTKCTGTRAAYLLEYEFRTETGELVKGSGEALGRQEVGALIWILFLAQNPRRSRPYPLSDYCVKE